MKDSKAMKGQAYDFQKPEVTEELKEYYDRLNELNTAPLWEVLDELVTATPRTPCVPTLWRYDELRPMLIEAGRLISTDEAERRVLILENPGIKGQSWITTSLYAAIQVVMPGEIAQAHRHTGSAFRFVLEGDGGGYTSVDGERTLMHPGDFVLTPSWTFHDHGNSGEEPTIWMDGLDIPYVNMMGVNFAEHWPEKTFPVTKNEGDAVTRYGQNLLPVDHESSAVRFPVFSYPYSRSRETLDQLYKNGPVHECHGIKLQFANPLDGGYPMATVAGFMQLLPAGFSGKSHRSTDGAVFTAVEGSGRTKVGDVTIEWKERDIFVVPSWFPVSHQSEKGAVLFSFSDRAAQKALNLWREEAPISG